MKVFYLIILSLVLSASAFAQGEGDEGINDFDLDEILNEAELSETEDPDLSENTDELEEDLLEEEFVSEDELKEDIELLETPTEADPVYTPSSKARLKKTSRGRYIYHPNQKKGLFKIDKDGNYYYKISSSKRKGALSVKGGVASFKNLQDPNTGLTYEDIYGGTTAPSMNIEWEWKPFKRFKTLSLKFASGLVYNRGDGRLLEDVPDGENPGDFLIVAQESYNFLYLPNSIGATYRFRQHYKQLFVPFITGGIDYHMAIELRNDFKRNKFLGIPATHFGGGIDINLGWLERLADIELDREFGINNTFFTLEARQIVSINKNRDITNTMFIAGFHFEY